MEQGNQLLTILHISDLHIGHIDPVTGNAELSQSFARLAAQLPWFDGVLGHFGRSLKDLDKFYWDLVRKNGKNPVLIVSGDLTRVGDEQEFKNANDFLISQLDLNPPRGNFVGLRYSEWRNYAIPGNHDHWPGQAVIFGGPHAALKQYFPPQSLPYVRNLQLANGRVLQLVGINTDADVHPRGLKRLMAVGSFQNQLAAAAPKLGPREDEQIRALLMHHSWDKRHGPLSIDRGSRSALMQFLVDHGIQLILSGHMHWVLLKEFVPPVAQANRLLECRCGTTTQNDQVPYEWRTLFGGFPRRRWDENTLLVHRLYDKNGTTHWCVESFVRTKTKGFDTFGPMKQASIIV